MKQQKISITVQDIKRFASNFSNALVKKFKKQKFWADPQHEKRDSAALRVKIEKFECLVVKT